MFQPNNNFNNQIRLSDKEHVEEEVNSENDSSIIKWKIIDNNEGIHAIKIPKIEPKSLLPIKGDEFEIYSIFCLINLVNNYYIHK